MDTKQRAWERLKNETSKWWVKSVVQQNGEIAYVVYIFGVKRTVAL